MTILERKLRTMISYALYFFGSFVFVFEFFVYNLLNPELTQMQIFIEKWPIGLICFAAFIVGGFLYPERPEATE